jgi:hypothetical protein
LNIKKFSLIIFIFSLVPGDTFYGDLGLTQSLFVVPLLFVYLSEGKFIPENKFLRNFGLLFFSLLTINLIVGLFSGIVEWYRTIAGVVLSFIVVTLFSKNQNYREQIKFLSFASLIPITAFFLGLWAPIDDYSLRMSFIKHDPNHLGHLLIYGFISVSASLLFSKKTNKIWFWLSAFLFFVPLAFTFSRTSLLVFLLIVVIYNRIFGSMKNMRNILSLLFIFLGITVFLINSENSIVRGFSHRFDEKDDSRTEYFERGVELATENFLTGVGLGDFQNPDWRVKNGFYRTAWDESGSYVLPTATHNGFLDVFLIGGVFLFITFIAIVIFPMFFLFRKSNFFENSFDLELRKYIVYSFTLCFLLINTTYSLYNSKLGWWGIAFSYVLIAPYYSTYLNKFKRKPPVYRRAEHASIAGI